MKAIRPRHVLITGAALGIGAATAARFAVDYDYLSLCDINEEALDRTVQSLGVNRDRVFAKRCDVGRQSEIEEFVDEACRRVGHLDALVNNAGFGVFGRIEDLTAEAWRQLFAVDLDSVFFVSRAAIPWMCPNGGCIVNTASISGLSGDPGLVAYNAAKAAIINMSRAMAVDYGAEQIRVNALCPGIIASDGARVMLQDETLANWYKQLIPLGRPGEPGEIAAVTHFLASEAASYITGAAILIDGGMTAGVRQPNIAEYVSRVRLGQ